MAREGLMDDTGYHGFDEVDEDKCSLCKHMYLEPHEDGSFWIECRKNHICEYEEMGLVLQMPTTEFWESIKVRE